MLLYYLSQYKTIRRFQIRVCKSCSPFQCHCQKTTPLTRSEPKECQGRGLAPCLLSFARLVRARVYRKGQGRRVICGMGYYFFYLILF
ncbi:hypothetical protein BDV26DRAFT_275143 [Aspergillus bertholletiae]|uniref:Uncharacterized protein n=1 Tax=Aspergillus bertholletiae TaxID=1226010 RepID=A0A5N7APY4_9EURO|nr:hypothetical protein BDV26DRAFT_275143 [Aspergillus bertholletiae]